MNMRVQSGGTPVVPLASSDASGSVATAKATYTVDVPPSAPSATSGLPLLEIPDTSRRDVARAEALQAFYAEDQNLSAGVFMLVLQSGLDTSNELTAAGTEMEAESTLRRNQESEEAREEMQVSAEENRQASISQAATSIAASGAQTALGAGGAAKMSQANRYAKQETRVSNMAAESRRVAKSTGDAGDHQLADSEAVRATELKGLGNTAQAHADQTRIYGSAVEGMMNGSANVAAAGDKYDAQLADIRGEKHKSASDIRQGLATSGEKSARTGEEMRQTALDSQKAAVDAQKNMNQVTYS